MRPIVTYNVESWILTNEIPRGLMTWKRRILRKIYGTLYNNGYW
jgi:hypothetical protein